MYKISYQPWEERSVLLQSIPEYGRFPMSILGSNFRPTLKPPKSKPFSQSSSKPCVYRKFHRETQKRVHTLHLIRQLHNPPHSAATIMSPFLLSTHPPPNFPWTHPYPNILHYVLFHFSLVEQSISVPGPPPWRLPIYPLPRHSLPS